MSVPIDRSASRSLVLNVSAKRSNRLASFCLFIFPPSSGFSVFRRIVHEHVLTVFDCPRVGVVSVVSVAQTFLGAFPFAVGLGFEPFNDLAQRFASHTHLSFSFRRCCLTVLRSTHSPSSSSVMPFSFSSSITQRRTSSTASASPSRRKPLLFRVRQGFNSRPLVVGEPTQALPAVDAFRIRVAEPFGQPVVWFECFRHVGQPLADDGLPIPPVRPMVMPRASNGNGRIVRFQDGHTAFVVVTANGRDAQPIVHHSGLPVSTCSSMSKHSSRSVRVAERNRSASPVGHRVREQAVRQGETFAYAHHVPSVAFEYRPPAPVLMRGGGEPDLTPRVSKSGSFSRRDAFGSVRKAGMPATGRPPGHPAARPSPTRP